PEVKNFQAELETYLGVKHVIPCANGTDALQVAMMALDLKPGDEVIVPTFTYVATAEVIALLQLTPVLVDVHPETFMIDPAAVEAAITSKTKAIVPVHLFGQGADMNAIMDIARRHNLFVIEDAAQALGASYQLSNGESAALGTIGDIGCTSFFPSKNLGCYGDGGALFTNNDELAANLRMIANHGQKVRYYHDVIGVNSRLDTMQAAILDIKLKHLNRYAKSRRTVADYYDKALVGSEGLMTPNRIATGTHVFHQYTLRVLNGKRDALRSHLEERGVPSMIYYPLPLHFQKAFENDRYPKGSMPISERLSSEVLSLPIHTEMTSEELEFIVDNVKSFFNA
ncbi:MAG: DegT/DnrJ/EryC1/StrS family aminotransferase, partial [Flavobacteriales bacterium]|nr:DegT/DnrJ/EryC1/StrS family aminotransferase [Flavobacteriales bacterium]